MKLNVTYNFDTGKYDVNDLEADVILSSWGTHAQAVREQQSLLRPKDDLEYLPQELQS